MPAFVRLTIFWWEKRTGASTSTVLTLPRSRMASVIEVRPFSSALCCTRTGKKGVWVNSIRPSLSCTKILLS